MYEQFGAREKGISGIAQFNLFLPDDQLTPFQYEGRRSPRIKSIHVVGNFQDPQNPKSHKNWMPTNSTLMTKRKFPDSSPKGWLYTLETPQLPDGFYEYKFHVTFENNNVRWIGDPCARYGGTQNQNSGLVMDHGKNRIEKVKEHPHRLPYNELIIYELMIDDFTKNYRGHRAPLDAITRKIKYLKELGINAIEFMPWTAWPNDDFSWGYNPFQYFSVTHRYTLDPLDPTKKIVYLKELINCCHENKIQVIMDGVFNHADAVLPDQGFAYYLLYQEPTDSPYVGNFAEHSFFQDLDYANRCTLEFILDVCKYWIHEFQIDGIRLDNTLGLYKPDDREHGLTKLLSELRDYLAAVGKENFALILEHQWDYSSIDVVNQVGATSCWYDKFRQLCSGYLGGRYLNPQIMRMLNSNKDFSIGKAPTIYIENHDHEAFVLKSGGRENWAKTQPYMIALFTCPGAVLIHNGQEFGEDYWMPEFGDGRVQSRPLRWERLNDEPGKRLLDLYKKLVQIRKNYPGLQSGNFYPVEWNEGYNRLNSDGFGVDMERKVLVYHRYGPGANGKEQKFYIVLNFSDQTQRVELQFPDNDGWEDLISGWKPVVSNWRLNFKVGSNYGHIFFKEY